MSRRIREALALFSLAATFSATSACGGRENGTNSGSSGSIGDGGTGGTVDTEIPDAFPASCAVVLDPDAAPDTCAFTPADVACNSNADCKSYVKIGCGCSDPVYGVNTMNTVRCFAPPCTPVPNGSCPADASGLKTQDCQLVPDLQSVAVACVNHQCVTYAAPSTSTSTGSSSRASSGSGGATTGGSLGDGCPTAAPTTGASCNTAGKTCVYDGCTACVCGSDGTWLCPGGGGDCTTCPTTITEDETCSSIGQACLRWSFCGGECFCEKTGWYCPPCGGGACGGLSCSNQPSCPGAVPNDGATCDVSASPCVYAWPSGCVQANCVCSSAKWSCSYENNGCLDAALVASE